MNWMGVGFGTCGSVDVVLYVGALKARSHGAIFLSATAFFNQIAVLQCEQYH